MPTPPPVDEDDPNSALQPMEPPARHASAPDGTLEVAQQRIADIFGDIAEFWGFTRTQGRIFGLVFMCPEPIDQATLRRRLSISAGSASMTLNSLVEWGVLHRSERVYVAETNFFKLITSVMKVRERERVEAAIRAAREVSALLRDLPENDPRAAFARQRVQHLLGFFETGLDLLDAVVHRNPVRALLNGLARKASRLRPPARAAAPHPDAGSTPSRLDV